MLKGENAKTLLSNFASLSVLQLVNIVLPLITLPYVLRVLGMHNYGLIVLAISVINYFHSITDYSFKLTATRDVAVSRNSQKRLNLIYSKVMIVKLLFLIVSYLVLTLIIFSYEPFYQERLVFFMTFPMLLGHVLFPEWYFQGIERMKFITILNVSVKVIFTIAVFLFIRESDDYWIYPLIQSFGFVISGVIAQIILYRSFKVRFILLGFKTITSTIKNNFPVFINQFLPNLYNNSTTLLLGVLVNSSSVGIYDAIKKIIDLGITLLRILSQVFFPYLNRIKTGFGKFQKIGTIACFGLIIGILLSNQLVFWYLNIEFENAFYVLLILSLGLFGFSSSNIYGTNYLLVRRKDKHVMRNTLIASISGFICAFPLIFYFGIIGAAINLTLSRLMMGGLMFYSYKKLHPTST